MIIVIMSGGGGSRLLPLSNTETGKQFVNLLPDRKNNTTTMIEQTIKAIRKNLPMAKLFVSIEKTQERSFHEKSMGCPCIIEPDRRDTYASILLSTLFLHEIEGMDINESIAFLPVDQIFEDSFYKLFYDTEQIIESDNKICLIGIENYCLSMQYGYFTVDSNNKCCNIISFIEKPTIEEMDGMNTKMLLCNSGVVITKIRTIINIIKDCKYTCYNNFLKHYSEIEKISFDRMILQNYSELAAVRYTGKWYDIGCIEGLFKYYRDCNIASQSLIIDGNIIFSARGKPIKLMNCEGIGVIETENGIVIAKIDTKQ